MGNCAFTPKTSGRVESPSAKVVHHRDGRLQEFRWRVTAAEILSLHPDCYLCSADTMVINSIAPQADEDHVLQFGQIYFLMPLSKSQTPLSLQDLCALAIKASAALSNISPGPILDHNRRPLRLSGRSRRDIRTF